MDDTLNPNPSALPVLVSGGGIGGLAAALAFSSARTRLRLSMHGVSVKRHAGRAVYIDAMVMHDALDETLVGRIPTGRKLPGRLNATARLPRGGKPRYLMSVDRPFYFTKAQQTLVQSGATVAYPPETWRSDLHRHARGGWPCGGGRRAARPHRRCWRNHLDHWRGRLKDKTHEHPTDHVPCQPQNAGRARSTRSVARA